MKAKRIGTIVTIGHTGRLVARAEGPGTVPVGTEVTVGDRTPGRVVAVFGPVQRPFLAIEPQRGAGGNLLGLVGKPVNAAEHRGGNRTWQR